MTAVGDVSDARTICGACQGQWPCSCSPQAVPVVLMESVDDDAAQRLSRRMAAKNDPLQVVPLDSPLKADLWRRDYCGHYRSGFDLDVDKRAVVCRHCGTELDAYFVLERLASMLASNERRLAAMQELERLERVREGERRARAKVRRHRYAAYAYRQSAVYCATCGGQAEDAIHQVKGETLRR